MDSRPVSEAFVAQAVVRLLDKTRSAHSVLRDLNACMDSSWAGKEEFEAQRTEDLAGWLDSLGRQLPVLLDLMGMNDTRQSFLSSWEAFADNLGETVCEQDEVNVWLVSRPLRLIDEILQVIGAGSKGVLEVISVFISHSHQDADLVKRLIVLLHSALNLPSSQIRATSVDGFRLPGGSNTIEQLRIEVQSAKILVGIISRASLKSAYVTFELGARWGSGKPMVPLLAPDVGPESLAGPLQGINALSCRSSAQLHQFVEETAGHLSVALDRPAAYQKCVDDIINLQSGSASTVS